jgi:D-cysteine desulfhydrase family pyridoxal phosphate-dependent enzyme
MHNLPRIKFAHLPTPVEGLPRAGASLGGLNLLVKRDDQTGLALGGNKTRKLEFLMAEARANGARLVITAGAVQSNHCRQTAAAAARLGLDCLLILTGDPPANSGGNLLIDQLLGAELRYTLRQKRDLVLEEAFAEAWEAGRRPYLVPYGGSSPTGAAAYAHAMLELLDQGYRPDWVVFASSSGGTHAGLVLGARLGGFDGRVLGISIDEPAEVLQTRVAELATQTANLIGENMHFSSEDILVNADFLGGGYGVMGAAEREAILFFARQEGLLLDPVYTGRAVAGLLALARQGTFKPGEQILFWHTGGAPALFTEPYRQNMIA